MPSNIQLLQERNRAFMAECRRQAFLAQQSGETIETTEAVRRACRAPAPSYFISYERAERNVSPVFHGTHRADTRSRTGRIALELAEKCRSVIAGSKAKISFRQALARVIASEPASCYFFSDTYGQRLYFRLLRAGIHRRANRLRTRRLF